MKYGIYGLAISALSGAPATLAYCGGVNIPFEVAFWTGVIGQFAALALFSIYAFGNGRG